MRLQHLLAPVFFAAVLFAECHPVTGARILGSDLARADSRFAAWPRDLLVGFSPAPGFVRTIGVKELKRLALLNGFPSDNLSNICFEVPLQTLGEEEVTRAMRLSLPAGARVRLLELSQKPVPLGEIRFPLSGLGPSTQGLDRRSLWRGYSTFSETQRFPVEAWVDVSIIGTHIVAARDLPAGVAISATDIRVETRDDSGLPASLLPTATVTIDSVVGLAPKAAIKRGAEVAVGILELPPVVRRGDVLRVEIQSGLARLHFDAIAETAGRRGDTVAIRNPLNGGILHARVDSASEAFIVVTDAGRPR